MRKYLAAMAAFLLLLVGCGGNKQAADPNIETTTTQVQTDTKNPLPKTNADTLNIAMPAGVTVFNPLDTSSSVMVNLLWLSFNSLFRVNDQGKIEGELIESYTYENGVYSFTLRSGVKFHNGKNLTANDVKYTVDKLKAKGEPTQARNTIYANAKEIIQEVNVTGDLTFTMKLKAGGISPLYALVFPIMPADGSNNGTGSYKITTASQDGMRFEAFADSWRKQPNIKTIQGIPFANDDETSKAYKDNKVDVVFVDYGSLGLYKYAQNTRTRNTRTNNYYYLLPNIKSGKLSNLPLRQALGYGIDRETVVTRAFDSNAILADYPIPSDYFVFDSELPSYYYDMGKCVRLFADNGYQQVKEGNQTLLKKDNNVFKLKVVAIKSSDLYNQNIASTLQSQLGEIGIQIEISLLSEEDYYKAISNGSYDLAIVNTRIPSEFNLQFLYGSGGARNLNGWKSSDMDNALSEIANSGEDMAKVKEGYSKLQTQLIKQLPQYGLCFTTNVLVYNDRVKNVGRIQNYDMLINILDWSFEGVDQTASTQTTID